MLLLSTTSQLNDLFCCLFFLIFISFLEFLNDDEYMEVTPESIRLRKQILNKAEREKANKKKKSAE